MLLLVDDLEANRAHADWPIRPRDWLQAAAHRAAEGFYADPSNGANVDRASWAMVGFRRTIERPLVQEKLLPRVTRAYLDGNDAARAAIRATALHRLADVPADLLTPELRAWRDDLRSAQP